MHQKHLSTYWPASLNGKHQQSYSIHTISSSGSAKHLPDIQSLPSRSVHVLSNAMLQSLVRFSNSCESPCNLWKHSLTCKSNITAQLLKEIEKVRDEPVWDEHADLLLWLICIGGVFAPVGPVRSGYTALLRSTWFERPDLYDSWSDISDILNQFIWSDLAFGSAVRKFLEER